MSSIVFEEEDERVHLIDGDIIAYRAASATEGRIYKVLSEEFKYMKDAKAFAALNGDPPIVKELRPEPVSHTIKLMKNMIDCYPNQEVYISDDTNFRYEVNPDYKADRKNIKKPTNLSEAKKWLIEKRGGVVMDNLEADDALIIRSTQLDEEGIEHLIVSVDKDLKQKAGWHLDPFSQKKTFISIGEARKRLWTQICTGDTTDGIHSPKGLGPKRAEKKLKDIDWEVHSDWMIFRVVFSLYQDHLPRKAGESAKEWKVRCMKNLIQVASQIYLRRFEEDVWQPPTKDIG